MLHLGARTRFILRKLTRSISVSFSIRQGDPIAMLLYIIYIEPLLIFIERRITGLPIENMAQSEERRVAGLPAKNVRQSVEAFCDDVNIITSDLNDLKVVDKAVILFEQERDAL